jgi:hypothetical protein
MPPKKKVPKQRDRLVRNLNDLYQDEALGSGMMRRVSRSPSVVPSGSSGATGRKSAPSPVATKESSSLSLSLSSSSSSSSEEEEEEHEVQQQDNEVQGREEEEEEAGVEVRPKVYVRGHSTLPERPILPVNRPIIRPEGTR